MDGGEGLRERRAGAKDAAERGRGASISDRRTGVALEWGPCSCGGGGGQGNECKHPSRKDLLQSKEAFSLSMTWIAPSRTNAPLCQRASVPYVHLTSCPRIHPGSCLRARKGPNHPFLAPTSAGTQCTHVHTYSQRFMKQTMAGGSTGSVLLVVIRIRDGTETSEVCSFFLVGPSLMLFLDTTSLHVGDRKPPMTVRSSCREVKGGPCA